MNMKATGTSEKIINLQRIYVKDISFELPNSPTLFLKKWEPKVDVRINTRWRDVGQDTYESILKIEVSAKNQGKMAFVAEVEQAGTFYIVNLNKKELMQALISACPNTLFPYARETLDHLLLKASLPPMHLDQINFQQVYEAKIREESLKKKKGQDIDFDEREEIPVDKSKIN